MEKEKDSKPTIEEIAVNALSVEKLKNFMNLVEYLTKNKLSVRNQGGRWRVPYKSKYICWILLDEGNCGEGNWGIQLHRDFLNEYDKYITDDELKKFILSITSPPRCTNKDCKGRENVIFLGKHFDNICNCCPFRVINPDGAELENLQKIILVSKDIVADWHTKKS